MDPNANLNKQRALSAEILRLVDKLHCEATPIGMASDAATYERIGGLASQLAEHVEALDTWVKGGGFLPNDWKRPCACVLRSRCCK